MEHSLMIVAGSACVRILNAKETVALMFDNIAQHCTSRSRDRNDYVFSFEFAQARVRSGEGVLWLHVESSDIATCHGTKMLVEAAISKVAIDMPKCVLWIDASREPFEEIMEHETIAGKT